MDRGAWWATVHGVTESDMAEPLSTALRYPEEQALKNQGQQICRVTTMSHSSRTHLFVTLWDKQEQQEESSWDSR